MKRKFIQIVAFMLAFILFIFCPLSVYASEKWEGSLGLTLYYNLEDVKQYINDTNGFWPYVFSQIGAIFKGNDWKQFMENYEKMDDLLDGNVGLYKENESSTVEGVFLSEEFMAELKVLLDDYAKQNEPYYMVNTLTLDDFAGSIYSGSKVMYDTVENLLNDSPSGVIAFGAYYSKPTYMYFADIGSDFKNVSPVRHGNNNLMVNFFDNETWNKKAYKVYKVELDSNDEAIKNASEFIENAKYTYDYGINTYFPIGYMFSVFPIGENVGSYPYNCTGPSGWITLVANDKRRIRVFNTYGDFQNYTLGKRSVYYTSNYYNYVPEDITTSVDDLQKSVDDFQNVIDDLLDQITKDTDESEIEDLLQQILDELKNQQGTESDSGSSGGGDVTVNVNMTQTNSWLAQIYAKVSQIYDKMNSTVEAAEDAALANIQESLDEIIEQLKKIKNWTAVDTVIDGVDAVADWLDLIHDVLKDGAGSAVSALSSALQDSTDLMKQKFPFSIPWDILFLVSALSAEPETPQFSIPFNFEISGLDLAVDYQLELDFMPLQWLSDLSRLLLSLTYAAGLMKKTVDIVSANKEG